MTRRTPITRVLSALLGLAALDAISPAGAQSWPDLTDSASYSFAGNRFAVPSGAQTSNSNVLGHVMQVSPPYAVSNLRLAFANFYVDTLGNTPVERCPGNPSTIDFATVFVGGAAGSQVTDKTAYTVTFGGAAGATIGDCEFVWSDPLRDASGNLVALPAGTLYYVRSNRHVGAGQNLVFGTPAYGALTRWANPVTGDGVEYSSGAPQTARRTTGTVAAFGNGQAAAGPAAAIGTGWDGSPVFLIVGDSHNIGQADDGVTPRGIVGQIERALDDTASTRRNFAMFAVGSTRAGTQSSIAAGEFRLRMRLLRSIPNRPFNRVIGSIGANDLTSVPNGSLAAWTAALRDWWSFWHVACPTCLVYHKVHWGPHAGQANNSLWTDAANQTIAGAIDAYPSGLRWRARDWLNGPGSVPSYVTVLDTNAAVTGPNGTWKVTGETWTAGAAIPAGTAQASAITLAGAAAPSAGDWYAFDPGVAGSAEVLQSYAVSGTGPWTVLFTGNFARAHAAGATIRKAASGDGTHPGTYLHKLEADALIAKKQDGTIH